MKYSKLILIANLFFCFYSNAQTIDMPIDRVKSLLCKKWTNEYDIYGEQKVYRAKGVQNSYYEFKKNNTFLSYTDTPNERIVGTWEYIPEKKLIKFGANGKYDTVFSIEENKLVTQIKVAEGTPHIFRVFKTSNWLHNNLHEINYFLTRPNRYIVAQSKN